MKVLIGTNCLTEISASTYGNHKAFFAIFRKHYPDIELIDFSPRRMSIDFMRNQAAKLALENECDYLMFIDDDVMVHPNTFKSLYEANKDVVMALTYVRGYPFNPMFFKEVNHDANELQLSFYTDFEDNIDKETGLVECYAVGFSCVLIKTEILKALEPPYFITGPYQTEDVYFCCKAKNELDSVSIFVDTKVPTGHIMEPQVVSHYNVKLLREMYEKENKQEVSNPDRGAEYLKQCLASLKK